MCLVLTLASDPKEPNRLILQLEWATDDACREDANGCAIATQQITSGAPNEHR
uniref:Uncharacterized protein n=1 Tax=uncultured organism TaxID=155900 RepID=A0A7L9QBY5_9ZZZZ|nr:hypothetical protein [uncultured organism]